MGKMALFIVAVIMATTAAAQAQNRTAQAGGLQAPAASQTTQAPFTSGGPDVGPDHSRPLFSIGRLPVVVWSPVQRPYDVHMNRTAAANPFWVPDAF